MDKRNMSRRQRRAAEERGRRSRRLALILGMLAVLLVAGISGTIAWLIDTTEEVENVFTAGDINIELAETTETFKMIPGNDIMKDPTVTVKEGSEACWLFVEITESSNLDDFIDYTVADNGWTALTGAPGVYYRAVDATTEDTSFAVLEGNEVTVLSTVTKGMMEGLAEPGATQPTLTFQAYAVQQANVADAAAAWDIAKP